MRGSAANGIRDELAGLPDVRGVDVAEGNDGRIYFQVFPKGEAMLIEVVGRLARERGWEIEELRLERGQLDEVFRRVTLGEGASE